MVVVVTNKKNHVLKEILHENWAIPFEVHTGILILIDFSRGTKRSVFQGVFSKSQQSSRGNLKITEKLESQFSRGQNFQSVI